MPKQLASYFKIFYFIVVIGYLILMSCNAEMLRYLLSSCCVRYFFLGRDITETLEFIIIPVCSGIIPLCGSVCVPF